MATLLHLKNIADERGCLTVLDNLEDLLPFPVRRIFYIQRAQGIRGGHRHNDTQHAVIALVGSCKVTVHDGRKERVYNLNKSNKCLILSANDWHIMHDFSADCILLALASTVYDPTDYIYTPYQTIAVIG
jgi:dTDP-4-dehydrorhamnose 3,5-epimerase-like enzyme